MAEWAAAFYPLPATGNPSGEYDPLATGTPLASQCLGSFWTFAFASPAPGVPADFGMRSVRDFEFTTGKAVLRLRHEDGVRVYVDGVLVHGQWTVHSDGTVEVPLFAAAGEWHRVTIEYFDHLLVSIFEATFLNDETYLPGPWAPTGCPVNRWQTRLYDRVAFNFFSGTYGDINLATLDDSTCESGPKLIDKHKVDGDEELSARIERDVVFPGGITTFDIDVDEGVRIFIDGRRIMDDWAFNGGSRVLRTDVPAGSHRVLIEFRNNFGSNYLKLRMTP